MTRIQPRKISGPWAEGRVLDVHSTSSTFLGYDEYGRERFETARTDVGELLYRLKYQRDNSTVPEIGDIAEQFIRSWGIGFDLIVPAPPTRARSVQPLYLICGELGKRFRVPVTRAVIKKVAAAVELKDLHEYHERRAVLENSLSVQRRAVAGKRVLLVDDLIRSGATLGAVAEALAAAGTGAVFAFALTQTRRV